MSLLGSVITTLIVVLGVMTSTTQNVASECSSGPVTIPFLTKPGDGWDVSFAKQAKVMRDGQYILSDGKDTGLRYIEYEAKKQVISLPHIEVNFCTHAGIIRDWHLLPKQVIGFEKKGHVFAYQVWVQMVSGPGPDSQVIGSNTHVIFYDMHGDGIFESVRIGAGVGMPLVPDWVEKASRVR